MGCDIHPHIEVKIDGKWHHYSAPPLPRWYAMFEKICGVRGDVSESISPPRGLPEDCTAVTLSDFNRMKLDAHSSTYLSGEETVALIQWAEGRNDSNYWDWAGDKFKHIGNASPAQPMFQHERFGYLFGNHFTPRGDVAEIRFICWFDC